MNIEELNEKMNAYMQELQNTTDRACVIVSAAYLDDILRMSLNYFLVDGSKAENTDLFDSNGPLSTFSSKIKMTYRLGLISKFEYLLLEKIRKIRNRFAHDVIINTLENEKIRGIVIEMEPPRRLLPPSFIPIPKTDKGIDIIPICIIEKEELKQEKFEHAGIVDNELLPEIPQIDKKSCRDIFEKTVKCLVNILLSRAFKSKKDKRQIPTDYFSVLDVTRDRSECVDRKSFFDKMSKLNDSKIRCENIIHSSEKSLSSTLASEDKIEMEDHLQEAIEIKNDVETELNEMDKLFHILNLQAFIEEQLEKALKKERLI